MDGLIFNTGTTIDLYYTIKTKNCKTNRTHKTVLFAVVPPTVTHTYGMENLFQIVDVSHFNDVAVTFIRNGVEDDDVC